MLTQPKLKKRLFDSFQKLMSASETDQPAPLMSSAAAAEFAQAYDLWVKESQPKAGLLTIVSPGLTKALEMQLKSLPLLKGWGPGLLAYWTPVVWGAAPGFSPANPTVPAAVVAAQPEIDMFVASASAKSLDEAADRIADILHRYTLKLTVLATPIPGSPTVLPIL